MSLTQLKSRSTRASERYAPGSVTATAVRSSETTYEIEFRGQEKAKHAHDVMSGFMS